MTDKLRDPLLAVMNLPTHRETLFGMAEGPALYEGQRLYLKRSEVLVELAAALAAAPQPAPDRETLESIIYNSADAYIEEHDRRAIADALLARGLRLPGGDETMAWAVVGEDGEVIPGSIYPTRDEAERVCDYEGERVVPVTIRVVEGGDDAA